MALSGEGADELFGGYLTYRANNLARYAPAAACSGPAEALPRRLRAWPVSDEKISLEYKLKRFLEGCRMAPERAHVYWNGTFSDAEKRALTKLNLPGALDRILGELALMGDNLGAWLWFDQKYYLPDDILAKVDRISMAHSIEVRPPFLDHRIAEFTATLPDRLQIDGSKQKVLLRKLMSNRLPQAILGRGRSVSIYPLTNGCAVRCASCSLILWPGAHPNKASCSIRRPCNHTPMHIWSAARTMDITCGAL